MDLKTQIFENMKAAMKDKNASRVAALRLIRDALQKAEIAEGRAPGKQVSEEVKRQLSGV